jgi:Fe-S cluster assembly protein SufD
MGVTALNAEPLLRRLDAPRAGEAAALAGARAVARERFLRHGLPHRKVEAWKYTDLRPLQAIEPAAPALTAAAVAAHRLGGEAIVLVFSNGVLDAGLSSLRALDGIEIAPLSQGDAALLDDGATPADAMAALNAATARDGAVIRVAPGAQIDVPVQVIVSGGVVRNLVHVGKGASLTLVETAIGDAPFTSLVTRVVLESGAELSHAKLVRSTQWHIGRTMAEVGTGARFHDLTLTAGNGTTRSEVLVTLQGEGAACTLGGANLGRGTDHHDYLSRITHAAPGCTSAQNFRAVADGRAVSVFQGQVSVAVDAQKTDAQQLHRALLLSDHTVAYAKPELEILADDVKCSHGATVGDLRAEELFYLRSRGIGTAEARRLLVGAFVAELLEPFADAPRAHLDGALDAWLEQLA